jgi:hypothetical protein
MEHRFSEDGAFINSVKKSLPFTSNRNASQPELPAIQHNVKFMVVIGPILKFTIGLFVAKGFIEV